MLPIKFMDLSSECKRLKNWGRGVNVSINSAHYYISTLSAQKLLTIFVEWITEVLNAIDELTKKSVQQLSHKLNCIFRKICCKNARALGLVAYIFNPSTQETEERGSL